LIAVVTLGQLPVGPSVGAAAAVLILGRDGVAAAAAAGVLMTVTGTLGGLCFAGWAGADRLWSRVRRARPRPHASAEVLGPAPYPERKLARRERGRACVLFRPSASLVLRDFEWKGC
jgi:hypothetical protein